jgi:hypothetical protein
MNKHALPGGIGSSGSAGDSLTMRRDGSEADAQSDVWMTDAVFKRRDGRTKQVRTNIGRDKLILRIQFGLDNIQISSFLVFDASRSLCVE